MHTCVWLGSLRFRSKVGTVMSLHPLITSSITIAEPYRSLHDNGTHHSRSTPQSVWQGHTSPWQNLATSTSQEQHCIHSREDRNSKSALHSLQSQSIKAGWRTRAVLHPMVNSNNLYDKMDVLRPSPLQNLIIVFKTVGKVILITMAELNSLHDDVNVGSIAIAGGSIASIHVVELHCNMQDNGSIASISMT